MVNTRHGYPAPKIGSAPEPKPRGLPFRTNHNPPGPRRRAYTGRTLFLPEKRGKRKILPLREFVKEPCAGIRPGEYSPETVSHQSPKPERRV